VSVSSKETTFTARPCLLDKRKGSRPGGNLDRELLNEENPRPGMVTAHHQPTQVTPLKRIEEHGRRTWTEKGVDGWRRNWYFLEIERLPEGAVVARWKKWFKHLGRDITFWQGGKRRN